MKILMTMRLAELCQNTLECLAAVFLDQKMMRNPYNAIIARPYGDRESGFLQEEQHESHWGLLLGPIMDAKWSLKIINSLTGKVFVKDRFHLPMIRPIVNEGYFIGEKLCN